MDVRSKQIKNLLWKEVASKSSSAAVAFTLISLVIFFYHFQLIQMKFYVQAACVSVVIVNLVRIWISKKICKLNAISDLNLNILRSTIWSNTICWSFIFTLGAYELNSNGFHFIVLITIMTGFVSASVITLAYDKTLFIPYQIITLIPMAVVALYESIIRSNPLGYYLALNYSIFLIYQLKQYRDYRVQLIQRFNYQLDLEESYVELKKSQSALIEQTSELIHVSKISALGDMAGGLAHEINNSLMVILGSTQQVHRSLVKSESMNPEIETKFRKSTDSIMRIKSVIEGLKQFSMQMGPQPKEDIPLREIIERTLSYTAELLKAHETSFNIDDVPEINIHCHPFQIIQVLFNLIKNADDAMVEATAPDKWVRILFAFENECILIKVINGGTLVSPENIQKLFQPFFTTKDVGLGTGLSLSIAKGIARDHKGDLYFEKNLYTTFVLTLPRL